MIHRDTGFGCGCSGPPAMFVSPDDKHAGFGGFFSMALNVAGSFVGDPQLGSQIASTAGKPFAKIKETPAQIAARVAPDVRLSLTSGASVDPAKLSPQARQIGQAVAADVAAQLAAQGVYFPPGSVGAELQHPSYLNAFGGQNAQWVLVGGLALGALVLFKGL